MLLSEVKGDTPVVLTTLGHTESLRLGERTLRRHAVDGLASVPRALRQLAESPPPPQHTEGGPDRQAILAMVSSRLEACVQAEARERLSRLTRALSERARPSHGPLAPEGLWEAERLLAQGDLTGAQARLEAHEANRGREPGTLYLRARLALLRGQESPRVIAQRVGQLALAMSDFPEAVLLAAQAWNAAGDTRSAAPFARDLVSNPRVHDELRAAAESILRSPRVPAETPLGDRDFEGSGERGDLRPLSQRPPPPSRPPPRPRTAPPPPLEAPPTPRVSSPSPAARSVPPSGSWW